jgi:hypothetical protein
MEEVLSQVDNNTGPVLAAGFVVFAGTYLLYIEAIRLGFKHRTHAIPVLANMYFLAHDVVFAALFQRWFVEIGHWFYKAFWAGILLFLPMEIILHYQTLKYSRQELFPSFSQRQYVAVYVAMQVGVAAVFWWFFQLVNAMDPLFLVHFAITDTLVTLGLLPMLQSRRSRKGQSMLLALGVLVGSNVGYFFLFLPTLSGAFTAPAWRVLGGGLCLLTLTYMWALSRYPREPAREEVEVPGADRLPATLST